MSTPTSAAVSPDSGTHWAAAGAWPAAPGIHRIPLPLPMDGLKAVNVYAIEDGDRLTMVDAGWAIESSRELLEKSLADIGRGLGDIDRFLVTHVHRDHYTQAVTVRRDFGAKVSLGLGDKPNLDSIRARVDARRDRTVELLLASGAPDLAKIWGEFIANAEIDLGQWEDPDSWLGDDQPIPVGERTLTAVSTPGHTQGHVVFADDSAGLLFAGDHVLPTITPSIGFEPAPALLALGDFLGSLLKVRARPDALLLPAHGPVAPSVHARVDELLVHHDHRLELCAAAVDTLGSPTAREVAGQLPWTRHERTYVELDTFNSALATLETRAHLELLVARGRVSRDGRCYRPVSG